MKAKVLIALTVAVLFGISSMAVYYNGNVAAESDVRICPNTGLPCDGDGLCAGGNGEACGGGCCEAESKDSSGCAGCASDSGCNSEKMESDTSKKNNCDGCPNKAAGTCPGKAAKSTESVEE